MDRIPAQDRLATLVQNGVPKLADLFASNPDRATRFGFDAGPVYADFSKQRMTPEIHNTLVEFAQGRDVEGWRKRMFAGEKINTSENRAVLHPVLRGTGGSAAHRKQVRDMRACTRECADKVRNEKKYKAIVHIGIGGSDLGPRLCADILEVGVKPAFTLRFAGNVDGASINDALAGLDPKSTLVIVVSKSFGTQETLMNGLTARNWLGTHTANMMAVTANRQGALMFGVPVEQIFDFWNWVGGRFSLWSAVSLSLQFAFGPAVFDALLEGAADMDRHFLETPLENNLPVMMALTSYWNRSCLGASTQAIIAYARRLRKLPAFLQQLEMESNGKSASRDGKTVSSTSPIIWGAEGTNGQHAFFQYLHQGSDWAPVDFIAVLEDIENRPRHHKALLANCFAQSEALMRGKPEVEVRAELKAQGFSQKDIDALAPQKIFLGNRPSTTILLGRTDAHALGALLALYEHKVFVASVLLGLNAFDQWGVELGKHLAKTILPELDSDKPVTSHDSSTNTLINLARQAFKSRGLPQ